MSVVEVWSGREGSYDASLARTYVRRFRVLFADESAGSIEAEFAPGIPRVGDAYASNLGTESDPLARCVRVSPRQREEDPRAWMVDCEYQTPRPGDPQTPSRSSPSGATAGDEYEARPPTWRWGSDAHVVAVRWAFKNPRLGEADNTLSVPVVNAAGDVFDPLPTRPVPFRTLTYTDYRRASSELVKPKTCEKYLYTCNSDTFLGYAPGMAMCLRYDLSPEWVGEALVGYRRDVEFRFAPPYTDYGFSPTQVLNAGYNELKLGATASTRIFDRFAQPSTTPIPLQANGPALTAEEIKNGQSNYISFHLYARQPFAEMDILAVGE
jgi:hypothetical protein